MNEKILCIFVGLLVLFGCEEKVENPAVYMESAKAYYDDDKYTEAQLELKNALQIDSELPEAYYYLALIDEKNQNWSGMLGKLEKTIELEPTNFDARLKLAKLYLLSKQLDKGKQNVEFVLENDVDNPDAIALAGAIYLKQGDTSSAMEQAEKALAIRPGHIDSVSLQAAVYMDKEDYKTAEIKVNKALETNPDELTLNILKLQIHAKSNNVLAVEQDYQNLIKRFPEKQEFVYALAKLYNGIKRDEEALALLWSVVEQNPKQIKPKLVLVDYLLQKDSKQAEIVLNKFLSENIADSGLYLRLANLYIKQKKIDEAKSSLNWVVDNNKEDNDGIVAKVLLAKLALLEADNDTASKLAEEVLKVDAKNFEAILLKARLIVLNGLYDDAISYLQGVLRDYPKSDDVMALLGQTYLKKSSPKLADVNFRQALNLNPGNMSAVMPIVAGMVKNKDINRAEKVLQKALKGKPDHLGALQALAQVRLLKKDWPGIQKIVDKIAIIPGELGFSNYLAGKISQGQGLYEEAIKKYKLALSTTPELSDALKSMVVCYEALKQRNKMIVYLDEFMQNNPTEPYPLVLKSQLYSLGKDWDKALSVLNKGLQQWAEIPQLYEAIAQVYSEKNEHEKVIETYKKGLEKIPSNIRFRVLLATSYEAAGEYDKAVEAYEALIASSPDVDIAVNNLVSLLLDHFPGKESSARSVKLAKRFDKSKQPYFYDTYGWALLHNGDITEAVVVFKQVVSKMPNVPVFKYHLGVGYSKLRMNKEAIAVLEKALLLETKDNQFLEKDLTIQLLDELKAKENEVEKV